MFYSRYLPLFPTLTAQDDILNITFAGAARAAAVTAVCAK